MPFGKRDYTARLQTLLLLFFLNFEWHTQSKVGNIGILVLWRDRENLYLSLFSLLVGAQFWWIIRNCWFIMFTAYILFIIKLQPLLPCTLLVVLFTILFGINMYTLCFVFFVLWGSGEVLSYYFQKSSYGTSLVAWLLDPTLPWGSLHILRTPSQRLISTFLDIDWRLEMHWAHLKISLC